MNKIIVNNRKTLDELYADSALTIEGMDPSDESVNQFIDWLKNYTPLKNENVYVIDGSLMNMAYGLTGNNAYPEENCSIVCIKLSDIENFNAIIFPRFEVGGRWFDDIVDNNKRRENEKRESEENAEEEEEWK